MEVIENYYNIVILPPPEVEEYCIKVSREMDKRFGSEFVLGKTENLPHITLLHTAFARKDLDTLEQRLSALARAQISFKTHFSGFLTYPQAGFVTIKVGPRKSFLPLHEKVINSTKDLVDRSFHYRDVWDYSSLPDKAQKHVDEYTSPSVKESFKPHITLGRVKGHDQVREIEEKMKIDEMDFQVETLALCTLAEHHTCQDVVFHFPFG